MLFDDLARLRLDKTPDLEEERAYLIDSLLSDAGIASQAKVGIRKWWWGTEIERAWARLREVEERTVDLVPDVELLSRGAEAMAHAAFYLDGDDKRRQRLETLLKDAEGPALPRWTYRRPPRGSTRVCPNSPTDLRSSIVDVLRAAHAQADQSNQQARYLRNRLILASVFSVLSTVLIVFAQWWSHDIPILSSPNDWRGLLVVMLFGAVGALITAIPAMSKVPSDHGPFNLPQQQALLKLALGPLFAVIGLLILGSEVLQVGPPTTWPGILLLAVVFGAGQQAVTRYVDSRASEILTEAAASAPK
jgi:hypothetical protein